MSGQTSAAASGPCCQTLAALLTGPCCSHSALSILFHVVCRFDTEKDAARAYDNASIQIIGDGAPLNFGQDAAMANLTPLPPRISKMVAETFVLNNQALAAQPFLQPCPALATTPEEPQPTEHAGCEAPSPPSSSLPQPPPPNAISSPSFCSAQTAPLSAAPAPAAAADYDEEPWNITSAPEEQLPEQMVPLPAPALLNNNNEQTLSQACEQRAVAGSKRNYSDTQSHQQQQQQHVAKVKKPTLFKRGGPSGLGRVASKVLLNSGGGSARGGAPSGFIFSQKVPAASPGEGSAFGGPNMKKPQQPICTVTAAATADATERPNVGSLGLMGAGDPVGRLRGLLAQVQAAQAASAASNSQGSAPSGAVLNPAAGAAAAWAAVGAAAAPAAEQVAQGAGGGELYTQMLLGAGMKQEADTTATAAVDGNDWRGLWAEGSDHEGEGPVDSLMHTAGSGSPVGSDAVVQQQQQQQHKEQQQVLLAQMQQQQLAASPELLQAAGTNSTAAMAAAAVAASAALGSSSSPELRLSGVLQQGVDATHVGGAGAGRREQVDEMLQAACNLVDARTACKDAMGALKKCLNVAKAAQGKVLAAELQLVLQLQKRREQQQQREEQPGQVLQQQQQGLAALSAAASMGSLSNPLLGPMQHARQELQQQLAMMSRSGATTSSVQAAASFRVGDQPPAVTGAGKSSIANAAAAEGLGSLHRLAGDGVGGDPSLLQAQQQQQVQVQDPQFQQWLQQQEVPIEQQQQQHLRMGIPPGSLPRACQQTHQQQQLAMQSYQAVAAMPATACTLSLAAPHATPELNSMGGMTTAALATAVAQVSDEPLAPLPRDMSMDQDWLKMWLDQEQDAGPAAAAVAAEVSVGLGVGVGTCEMDVAGPHDDFLQALLAV